MSDRPSSAIASGKAPALVPSRCGHCSACGGKLPTGNHEEIIGDDGIPRCPHCYRCLSLADRSAQGKTPGPH